ncbi:hypothetical protein [Clostridium sp. E02]|uniref:hypothetical protein n=1 Tax=Clostridium sp. E02 TaxID=2487134 RepID=UPI000F54060C|nr:hypothetical protein [Clostridium sp. E02]
MKKFNVLLVTALFSLLLSFSAFAGEWKQNDTGWWYENENGTYPMNGIKEIDHNWYYFDKIGYMKTGWYQFEDGWFGFGESGACMNPFDYNTLQPIGGPHEGWIEYSGSAEATMRDISNGSVVRYNNRYWSDPGAYQEEVKYEHDVAPAEIKNRFGLADMQF